MCRSSVRIVVGYVDGDAVAIDQSPQLRAVEPERARRGRDIAVARAQRVLDPLPPLDADLWCAPGRLRHRRAELAGWHHGHRAAERAASRPLEVTRGDALAVLLRGVR